MTKTATIRNYNPERHALNDTWKDFDYIGIMLGDSHYVVRTSDLMSSQRLNKCLVLPTEAFLVVDKTQKKDEYTAEVIDSLDVLDNLGFVLNMHRIDRYNLKTKRKQEKGDNIYLGFFDNKEHYVFERGSFFSSDREIENNILVPKKALKIIAYDTSRGSALTDIIHDQKTLDRLAVRFNRLNLERDFIPQSQFPNFVRPSADQINHRANGMGSMPFFGESRHC